MNDTQNNPKLTNIIYSLDYIIDWKHNMNICRHVDLEDTFGLNADIFTLSSNKRKEQIEAGLRPSWKHDEHFYYRRLEAERSPSPARRWVAGGGVLQV